MSAASKETSAIGEEVTATNEMTTANSRKADAVEVASHCLHIQGSWSRLRRRRDMAVAKEKMPAVSAPPREHRPQGTSLVGSHRLTWVMLPGGPLVGSHRLTWADPHHFADGHRPRSPLHRPTNRCLPPEAHGPIGIRGSSHSHRRRRPHHPHRRHHP